MFPNGQRKKGACSLCVVLLLMVISADFASATTKAIGSPAVDKDLRTAYPYTVSLRRRSDLGYFCTGVLIGKRHVLTAAHCVDSSISSGDSRPQVVVGSASSTKTSGSGVQVISTKSVLIHPGFFSRGRFPELAILELSSAANQTPVRLPPSTRFMPKNNELMSLLGWGRRSQTSGNAQLLQIANVNFVEFKTCRRLRRGSAHSLEICTRGFGSCKGDDGGPIVIPGKTRSEDVLVGIVGEFHVCGQSERPDTHIMVAPHIRWIQANGGTS